jgi:hypothetical protein
MNKGTPKQVECFIWDQGFRKWGLENLGEPTASNRGSRGNTLGGPPGQSSDFQVAHKGAT